MTGLYIKKPGLIGRYYKDVADYPSARPIVQSPDGMAVYKGFRKVFLVFGGIVVDFYEWKPSGDQYRRVQKKAQAAWGLIWPI